MANLAVYFGIVLNVLTCTSGLLLALSIGAFAVKRYRYIDYEATLMEQRVKQGFLKKIIGAGWVEPFYITTGSKHEYEIFLAKFERDYALDCKQKDANVRGDALFVCILFAEFCIAYALRQSLI